MKYSFVNIIECLNGNKLFCHRRLSFQIKEQTRAKYLHVFKNSAGLLFQDKQKQW